MNMKMSFVQRNNLLKKDYKQFLVKNETKAVEKELFLTFFLFLFFHVFLVKVPNVTSADQK